MPLTALKATSVARNGVGTFILPCRRLDFHYCDWAGSSKGMNQFLETLLTSFATRSPSVAIHVSPRPGKHPVIRGHYTNGATKTISVRKLTMNQISQKAEILRDSSGVKNRKLKAGKFVQSVNESVRGVWSGVHADAVGDKDVWGIERKKAARK